MPLKYRALAAVVTTVLLWASAFVVIRAVGGVLSPGSLAFARLVVGTIALALVALRYRRPLPRGRALAFVIGYGVLWFAGYTVVLNWAERHLDAGTAALLVNVAPILVAVVAGIVFREGFPRPVVIGMLVAFAGVVVIAVGGDGGGVADTLGIVLGLVTAVLYAAGVLMQKVALRSVDAVTATWVGCAAGLVATLPFAPQAVVELSHAPGSAIAGVVFLGVGPTAIAFTTWAYALARTDAGRMAATTLCVPGIAVLVSWVTLGEVPTALGLLGGALCLAGVAISRRKPRVVEAPAEQVELEVCESGVSQ
ncbi:DMT family transporter [Kutzneria sp. CA-103260]|uniref:DMT family transporter n=1 Tax=Kutzneria sp. CA-103260 TaxID=2802641 RepID=UPI001BAAAE8B|nr:DMT family transporter [Kutzneria sp. CA-103260]QUQ70085.1 DMT family transporter [Kutzneria sp. CA-103260]